LKGLIKAKSSNPKENMKQKPSQTGQKDYMIRPKSWIGTDKLAENLEEFMKAEILVGEIKEVWNHPESEKLYCEKVSIGPQESNVRNIASGLRNLISIEGMAGKVLVFANLKPRKLIGFPSEGMILCASQKQPEGSTTSSIVEICRPDPNAQPGERVYLELPDFPADEFETVLSNKPHLASPSNSAAEMILNSLRTDEQGRVTYKGKLLRTKSGYLSTHTLVNCPVS
jgi:aminoacyl tRNA synthase complex-interacting multifunctional protein 1